ncbi:GntR family transcriptional regulator [Kocuria palustris]|uniref:GntR family transcriptional regulator n=1 Tax=Kocuria palustris TaxID=71999 RepID=UPI00119DB608|nr:GntR family transcriptional regulator [Kocuria palustris]
MAQRSIDHSSGVPLYRQIKEILHAEIAAGRFDAQTPITEAQLLERFSVSRAPIRQALRELTSEGWVYRKQGKGTFPIPGARVNRPADMRTGALLEFLREQGLDPSSSVSEIGRSAPPDEVAAALGAGPEERLTHFSRLISLHGEPLAHNIVYMRTPEDFHPRREEIEAQDSAFDLLEAHYGILLEHAEHSAWASTADDDQARILGLPHDSPVLLIDSLFYVTGGVLAGWRRATHRPDEFKYRFSTRR